jgi:hypothetical protein
MAYEWHNGDNGADTDYVAPWVVVKRSGKYYVEALCDRIVGGPYLLNTARLIAQAPNLVNALNGVLGLLPDDVYKTDSYSLYAQEVLELAEPQTIESVAKSVTAEFLIQHPEILKSIVDAQRKLKP